MVSLTNERALEMAIEKALTGTCLENVKAGLTDITQPHHGFVSGSPSNFDMLYALRYPIFLAIFRAKHKQKNWLKFRNLTLTIGKEKSTNALIE